jgi:hypothetical protein
MRKELLNGSALIDLPMQTRLAAIEEASVDATARTVELVWSTGAAVRRRDWTWDGPGVEWDEVLSLDPAHVDMTRMSNGAPLLNSHGRWDLEQQLGVVEKAWLVSASEARAVVRFSRRETVEPIFADVKDKVIRNVSVGYSVQRFEVDRSKTPERRTAVAWQPFEISLVAVGADAGAGTRSKSPLPTSPCVLVERAAAEGVPVDVLRRQLELLKL